jgi:arylsulfatase A-like enzyme
MVHYMDVHGPRTPLPEDLAALGEGADDPFVVDAYDASIRRVDRGLARLVEGLPDRAWIVLTSDHGEELLEGRPERDGVPTDVRHGHTLFQEALHVPLVVLGPGVRQQRLSRQVSTIDIAPTLLRIAGLPPAEGMTGVPLIEVVGGRAPAERAILAEALRYGREEQVSKIGQYKLVFRTAGSYDLYDLSIDPSEGQPVHATAAHRQEYQHLRAQLPQVGSAARVGPDVPLSVEVTELLRRLGYRE